MPREAFERVYMPSQKMNLDRDIPGPGQYTSYPGIGYEGRKFSV